MVGFLYKYSQVGILFILWTLLNISAVKSQEIRLLNHLEDPVLSPLERDFIEILRDFVAFYLPEESTFHIAVTNNSKKVMQLVVHYPPEYREDLLGRGEVRARHLKRILNSYSLKAAEDESRRRNVKFDVNKRKLILLKFLPEGN